jgi:hypothetical protein
VAMEDVACCIMAVFEHSTSLIFSSALSLNCTINRWWLSFSFEPSFNKNFITYPAPPPYELLWMPSCKCASTLNVWRRNIRNDCKSDTSSCQCWETLKILCQIWTFYAHWAVGVIVYFGILCPTGCNGCGWTVWTFMCSSSRTTSWDRSSDK